MLGPRYTNQKKHGSKVFKLVAAQDDGFTFEHKPFFGKEEKVKVELIDLKAWELLKGPEPEKCDPSIVQTFLVHNSQSLEDEMQKAKVQLALLQASKNNAIEKDTLVFTCGPSAVWSNKNIKKGELKLFPSGTVSKIKDGKTKGKLIAIHAGNSWAISSFKQVSDFSSPRGVLDPFHWVRNAAETTEVNMASGSQTVDKVQLPYVTNCKALKIGEQLLLQKPAEDEKQQELAAGSAAKKAKLAK